MSAQKAAAGMTAGTLCDALRYLPPETPIYVEDAAGRPVRAQQVESWRDLLEGPADSGYRTFVPAAWKTIIK